jgi:hypothetical protein
MLAPIATAANPIPRNNIGVNGRQYSVAANSYLDAPSFDADQLQANGWLRCGRYSGPTSARPLPTDADMLGGQLRDMEYFDSTLGYIVINDGSGVWRSPATGAVV